MAFRTSALALLALASAVSAQTAGFDAITTPLTDEKVPACANYVVKWDYTSTYPSTISIQLLEGASSTTLQLGPVLASGIDNSLGQYTWAVDCSLGADATYGLKITYDADSTGNTFQYSNPFQIVASSSSSSSSSAAAATTTSSSALTTSAAAAAATTTTTSSAASDGKQDQGFSSSETDTVFSTQYVTITSCAATVTDCPARSTVVSSLVSAVTSSAAAVGVAAPASSSAAVTPVFSSASSAATTGKPSYPVAGNGTSGASSPNGLGTVTLPAKSSTTGGASAASATTAIVTAGAAKVAAGSFAAVAGLAAAMFAL